MKKNCWEVKNCGRGPNCTGTPCPSATEKRLDGIHGGINGGRSCWTVAGTMCGGVAQGTFAAKASTCLNCEFYLQIEAEEGDQAIPTKEIILKIM